MKKIMLFSHVCNSGYMTGAEKMLLFMTRELSPNYQCILVVPTEGMLAAEARGEGIHVIVQPCPMFYQLWEATPSLPEEEKRLLESPSMGDIMNLLHMHRPDLVLSNTCVNALPSMASKRLGIPVLWVISETIQETPYTTQAVAIIHKYSDWIAGISETTLQPFRNHGLSYKLFVLYPSWQHERLQPEAWMHHRQTKRAEYLLSEQDVLIGYVASDLVPHKGLHHFISAAVSLCATFPHAHFLIAGNPTDRSYYDACVQNIHASGYATRFILESFHGSIQTLYAPMDILAVPSLIREGFGLTTLEGLIFGKPVVAYRSGALEEQLTAVGGQELLAPRGDIHGLTSILFHLLANPANRNRLGDSLQQAVHSVFGIAAYRTRLHAALQCIEPAVHEVERSHTARRSAYADGLLLKGSSTPAVFLIQGGHKRPFAAQSAFLAHGFQWDQVVTVPDAVLQWFPNADPIYG